MAEITAKGRIPLLVWWERCFTLKHLSQGLAKLPEANKQIRQQLLAEADKNGWTSLHHRLQTVDPVAAQRIKPSDTQRLQRALEVYEATGRSLSSWHNEQNRDSLPYHIINLAVTPSERSILHQRIAKRFQLMLDIGFEDEVRRLHARGDLDISLPSIRAVGYRQMCLFWMGN